MTRKEVMKQLTEKKWAKSKKNDDAFSVVEKGSVEEKILKSHPLFKKDSPVSNKKAIEDAKELLEEPKIDRRRFNGGTKKLQGEYKSTSVQTTEEERIIAMQAYGGIVKAFRWAIEQAKKKRGN